MKKKWQLNKQIGEITVYIPFHLDLEYPAGDNFPEIAAEKSKAEAPVDLIEFYHPAQVKNKSNLKRKIASLQRWLQVLEDGLDGKDIRLGDGQGTAFSVAMRKLGIHIVTKTAAEREGHELKKGAARLGRRYFPHPISSEADIYILNVHTRPKKKP